ncbi:MAG: hypothetical protein IH855_03255 [Bacteroidetes bacterium]|nr:hypothetical protein [Bacteroidota bacterium]
MKDDPKLSTWERIPHEYKRQLYAFLSPDHFHAIKEGRAKLDDAVDWIGYALDEIETVYGASGESAALQWMKEKMAEALECHPVEHRRYTEGGSIFLVIPSGFDDTRGELEFHWKGTSISSWKDIRTPDEKLEGAKAPKDRWLSWINRMGALYFFQNDLTDTAIPGLFLYGDLRFDELLITAMPEEKDDEIAVLFANKLTKLGVEGRVNYRLEKPTTKRGPNYPDSLVERVCELTGVKGKSTVRDRLERGGYVHPKDLRRMKLPKDQRPKRR